MYQLLRFACLFILLAGLVRSPETSYKFETTAPNNEPPTVDSALPADPYLPVPHPILSNLSVRRAIAYCTNKEALVAAAYPEITDPALRQALITDSFLPKDHWGYHAPAQQYPYDPELGNALLEGAGWEKKYEGEPRTGVRGELLAVRLYTAQQSLSEQYLTVFKDQMNACGIMVNIIQVNPGWLFGNHNGLQQRDFELTAFTKINNVDDPVQDLPGVYGCNSVPSLDNNWTGQNITGWCNPAASAAFEQAINTQLSQAERAALLAVAQDAFANDLPSLPLFRSEVDPNAWEHLDFNLHVVPPTTRPLSDIRVRRAIAHCTDKTALAQAGYGPNLSEEAAASLLIDTMFPKSHWLYSPPDITYPFDPGRGQQILAEAGWTLALGAAYRTNAAGQELNIKLTTTNAPFRMAWGAEFENQMAVCGIRIIRQHFSPAWLFGDINGLAVRDYEMSAYAWVSQLDPDGSTLWDCNQIPSPENGWAGQNSMGWCNRLASRAIRKAVMAVQRDMRQYYYDIVQQEYARDIPALPLFNRIQVAATAADLQGFAPVPGEETYTYNIDQWQRPGKITLVLGFTQEPATLYTLVDISYVAQLLAQLVTPRAYTTLNYDFQPYWMNQLSTLENGLARHEIVEVQEGDKIIDVNGNIVELKPGTRIRDYTDTEMDYRGGIVRMSQMVVEYIIRDDLKWQDGSFVTQSDIELGYRIACDRESGAVTFITCDRTKDIHFDGLRYTVTWMPGVKDPLYFLAPYGIYPSRQPVLSSGIYQGKTLAEVPARDWPSLPEVSHKPWSYGPYMIKEWIYGDRIEFQANPFFFKGAPMTPNIVIRFVPPEQATSSLITGIIDVLGWESLAGISDELAAAEQDGIVKSHIIQSSTWEHIDFLVDPLPVAALVTSGEPAAIRYTDPVGDPLTIAVPQGAVETTVNLIYAYQPVTYHPSLPPGQQLAGLTFTLYAYQNSQPLSGFSFSKPLTISFSYSDSDVSGLVEEDLTLFYWNGSRWIDAASTCNGADYYLERDPANNSLRMNICQLGEFDLMGNDVFFPVHLPIIGR